MVGNKRGAKAEKPDCNKITFSGHALQRMFERDISADEILHVVHSGEEIEYYPDESSPAHLLLGRAKGRPIHAVVARCKETGDCVVVTCYIPDKDRWSADFRRRITG